MVAPRSMPPPSFAGLLPEPRALPEGAAAPRSEARPRDVDEPTGTGGLGESIARRFFELCENPRTRDRMLGTLRSSARSAVGGRLLVAVLTRSVLTPLLRSRRVDHAAARCELVAANLGGVAVLRYVTRMEPVASMPLDQLVALVAPGVQATLDAPLNRP